MARLEFRFWCSAVLGGVDVVDLYTRDDGMNNLMVRFQNMIVTPVNLSGWQRIFSTL